MPNHIAWASSGKRDIGERGVHSHPYLCQEWRLRETHAEMPHKQELLEVYEISLTDVFGGKIQFAATTTDSKNIRLTKQRCAERVGFEPTVRFPARSLSRRVLSTAQPPLRGRCRLNRSRALRFSTIGHSRRVTRKSGRAPFRPSRNLRSASLRMDKAGLHTDGILDLNDEWVSGVLRRKIGSRRRNRWRGRQR